MIVPEVKVAAIVALFIASADCAYSAPRTQQNGRGETIEVSGFIEEPGSPCQPFVFSGRIADRKFAADAVTITGLVIEEFNGTRSSINVEIPSGLSMAIRGTVYEGLQRLSKVGRIAHGRGLACGAAGRFLTLDEIQ